MPSLKLAQPGPVSLPAGAFDRVHGSYIIPLSRATSNHPQDVASRSLCDGCGYPASLCAEYDQASRDTGTGRLRDHRSTGYYLRQDLCDKKVQLVLGKIDLRDFFDANAVADCEVTKFLARPLVNNVGVP